MNERRVSRNQYSAQEVAEVLDNLISAWYGLEDARRALAEFKDKTLAPDLPQVFNDVAHLTTYKNEELRYQKRLDKLTAQRDSSDRQFKAAVERAEEVLPVAGALVHVFHVYRASDPQRSGKYRITYQRNRPEGPIAIARMDD